MFFWFVIGFLWGVIVTGLTVSFIRNFGPGRR